MQSDNSAYIYKDIFRVGSLKPSLQPITETCLYNFDPFKPHFYIVKLGFTGCALLFLFLLQNIECGYSLEPPRRVPTFYVLSRNVKNLRIFFIRKFSFFGDKIFSIFE